MSETVYSPTEEFLTDVKTYTEAWDIELTEENLSEDEDFLYLEIETEQDLQDEFMELGNHVYARSSAVVNSGERYILSVEK